MINDERALSTIREMAERDLNAKAEIFKAVNRIERRQIIGLIFSILIILGVVLAYLTLKQTADTQVQLMKSQNEMISAFVEILKELKNTK